MTSRKTAILPRSGALNPLEQSQPDDKRFGATVVRVLSDFSA
jgi:hypothetical protein